MGIAFAAAAASVAPLLRSPFQRFNGDLSLEKNGWRAQEAMEGARWHEEQTDGRKIQFSRQRNTSYTTDRDRERERERGKRDIT